MGQCVRRRILLVGINFSPEQTGIAPYTTGMARHLGDRGDEVLVLTGMPHYPSWSLTESDRRIIRRHETFDGIQARRLRHSVPRTQTALRRGMYEGSITMVRRG